MTHYLVSTCKEVEAENEAEAIEEFKKWLRQQADRDSFEVENTDCQGFRLFEKNRKESARQ